MEQYAKKSKDKNNSEYDQIHKERFNVDGKKIEDVYCWKREEKSKVESDLFKYIGNEFICNDKLEIDKKSFLDNFVSTFYSERFFTVFF